MSDQIQVNEQTVNNPWATDTATSVAPTVTDSAPQSLSAAADPWGASMAEGSNSVGSATHEAAVSGRTKYRLVEQRTYPSTRAFQPDGPVPEYVDPTGLVGYPRY